MNPRGSNQNSRPNTPMTYQQHSGTNNFVPQPQNPNPYTLVATTRNPRHYPPSDMKSNHMTNMQPHGPIQVIPSQQSISHRQQTLSHHIRPNTPRNLPRGPYQYQVYLPGGMTYSGNNSHAYYPYAQQASPTVLMPFLQNYSSNQSNLFYSSATPRQPMANIQQGLSNTPVANMSAAQNSHGPSLIVQPPPMEMPSNSQPLQVQQQQPSTPLQPTEPRPQKRTKNFIKITHPETGVEIDIHKTAQLATSAVELEKMKVQSQFQSQVQSAVKKDDKVSDDNQNIEGEDKVRNEFASQVKKLATEPNSSGIEDDISTKATEVVEAQLPEEVTAIEELDVIVPIADELPVENSDKTSTIDLTTNTEEVLYVSENVKETNTNALSSSTPTHELPPSTSDIVNSEGTNSIKKNPEEESVKPVKQKKNKNKKKKNVVKETDETLTTNVQPLIATEPVTSTQENKENEFVLPNKNEDISQPQLEKDEVETETQIIEIQPEVVKKLPSYLDKLSYAEGQWSTINQTGKRIYSKSFLLQLGNESICQKKPDILNSWSNITRLSNQPQYGGIIPVTRSQSASATGFLPSYFKPGNSQRGGMPIMPGVKRNSSQGKTASKTAKPNTIHMSLSLREEVKLNQTDNAWVPTVAKKNTKVDVSKNKDEEELKTEDVNKTVRSILNKITPDNMDSLTLSFRALSIDTAERLEQTIDLVFEKAIEEQSFAPLYASLCASMQSVQVSSGEGGSKKTFKKLIISKCQSLFEFDKAQEMDSAKKLSEINSCKDPEKKKILQLDYEENERRLRKRSVGNCRFIGELFKQKILTPNIMLYCIVNLVTKHVEEPLECLCNLLKTVGKELEQSFNLNETFEKLKHLSSKEMKSKIPSRIRFMIQDVIDLRRDKWVPRRNDSKPKLINEIEKDAKNEALEQSMALSSFNRQDKRDHHRSDEKFRNSDNRDNRDKNRRNDAEWNVVQNAKFKQTNYTIDQSKLQGIKESAVTTLGPSSKWSFANNSSAGSKNSSFTSSNTFAALNDEKKSSTTSQMMSNKNNSRKPIISESEERQRMMSGVASMMPQFAQSSTSNSVSSSQPSKEVTSIDKPVVEETADDTEYKISMLCKHFLREYSEMQNLEDIVYSLADDEKSIIRTRKHEFVKAVTLAQLDINPNSRVDAGKLFAELLSYKHKDNIKVLSMVDVTQGIDSVLKEWKDYLLDFPQFFPCIAAIIASLLISKTACFEISNLKATCVSICPDNSSILFTEIIQKILSSKETQNIKEQVGGILWVYNKWRMSDYVPLNTFMPINQLNKYFINDRVGVFLLSVTIYDKMRITDHKPFYELMSSWITSNIKEEIIKCPQFMRALTIAIVMMCLKPNHSFEDFFDHGSVKLLTSFMGSKPIPGPEIQAREVQCLYGIQIMSAALEHPGGMVLKLFHKLYENSVISKESFEFWKKEYEFKVGFDEDLETKTMAVVVLNSFFLSLSINDSDDDDTADQ